MQYPAEYSAGYFVVTGGEKAVEIAFFICYNTSIFDAGIVHR